ncbi:MAG: S8 family serine peptidase [Deltaproteobacteria bacterium]|nr:S8 family serine peptidase [Deltaproteobacteria bacterium]
MKRIRDRARLVTVLGLAALILFGYYEVSNAGKIAPNLEFLLSNQQANRSAETTVGADGTGLVRVIVQAGCNDDVLQRSGFRVSSRVGDVLTGSISADLLSGLSALPCVTYVEAPSTLKPNMDMSYPAIKGNLARSGSLGAYSGLTGRDVIVAVIDTGIDLNHPDFKDADGKTRVLWVWDQTVDGTPPSTFTYGNECSQSKIEAGECTEADTVGHGTHVAGVAAGNGQGTGNGFPAERYVSAAPEADLIIVEGSNDGGFETDRLIDAISYVLARAEEAGKPVVVNLSLGSQFGPHDGTSLIARTVDNASGPGKVFIISAGNEGNNLPSLFTRPYVHASGQVPDTVTIELPACRNEGSQNDFLSADIWYDTNMCVGITVTSPNGFQRSASTGESNDMDQRWTEDGYIYIDNSVGGVNPNNLDHEALIQIFDFFDRNSSDQRVPTPGVWTIQLTKLCDASDTTYHLWVFANQFCTENAGITSPNATNNFLIASPGDAVKSICVGAFTVRNTWTNVNGDTVKEDDPINQIAYFSNTGPTRDGRTKPDITAPGSLIISSLSSRARTEFPVEDIVDDGVHAIFRGTSFSAPHVTSATALLLQIDSQLEPFKILDFLKASADSDSFTGRVPNTVWGFGKVNILEALQLDPPQGPEITSLTRVSGTVAELSWDEPMFPATAIIVERKAGETGTWEHVATLPGTDRSYRDETLIDGTVYYYRIAARYNQLQTSYSEEKSTSSSAATGGGGGGGGCFIQTVR